MAQRVYATAIDYAALAEEPADVELPVLNKRLRAASSEVDGLTRLSRYDVDEDNFPTDATISDAFKEATCAIVEFWEETGDVHGADAAQGAVKIGSVSLGTTSSTQQGLSPREKLVQRIGESAVTILTNAGLISATVYHS
jgi:hypothetical protein